MDKLGFEPLAHCRNLPIFDSIAEDPFFCHAGRTPLKINLTLTSICLTTFIQSELVTIFPLNLWKNSQECWHIMILEWCNCNILGDPDYPSHYLHPENHWKSSYEGQARRMGEDTGPKAWAPVRWTQYPYPCGGPGPQDSIFSGSPDRDRGEVVWTTR